MDQPPQNNNDFQPTVPSADSSQTKQTSGLSSAAKAIIILFVLLVVGGGAYAGYYFFFSNTALPSQTLNTNQNANANANAMVEDKLADEAMMEEEVDDAMMEEDGQMVEDDDVMEEKSNYTYRAERDRVDSLIIKTDVETGEDIIVIESVQEVAGLSGDMTLHFLVSDDNGNLYFRQGTDGTHWDSHNIWKFDSSIEQLILLPNISAANFNQTPTFNQSATKALVAENNFDAPGVIQNLLLLDLTADRVSTLVELSGDETFNADYSVFSATYDYRWIDDSTVEYSVYDESQADPEEKELKPLIGTRTISLDTGLVESVEPQDTDGDGLSDDEEVQYGTDPNNPDTDGDGYIDGEEVKNGYNPNGPGTL